MLSRIHLFDSMRSVLLPCCAAQAVFFLPDMGSYKCVSFTPFVVPAFGPPSYDGMSGRRNLRDTGTRLLWLRQH